MFSFPLVDPDLGTDVLFERLTPVRRDGILKKILWTLCLQSWGFHVDPVYFFNIYSDDLHFDTFIPWKLLKSSYGGGAIHKDEGAIFKGRVGPSRHHGIYMIMCTCVHSNMHINL